MQEHAYIRTSMKRLLLAFLALLAGLVVQGATAQARISGSDAEIGAYDAGRTSRPVAVQSQSPDAPAARQERRERDANRVRTSRARVYIPTVQFGADRAFE